MLLRDWNEQFVNNVFVLSISLARQFCFIFLHIFPQLQVGSFSGTLAAGGASSRRFFVISIGSCTRAAGLQSEGGNKIDERIREIDARIRAI